MIRYFFVFLAFVSMNSIAAEIDSKTLILSCREYVAIYDRRGEKSLLASISTSPAEAMRAGICRGMLEEHAKHQRYSCGNQWYQQASVIANQDPELYQYSKEQLLDEACDG
ncbi:hypothetical protein Maes01_01861 [Microbulbifer aestuariivivens]|uniref:Uncharacterized protein n=1 Tax=Microbulbifer aestuariivivens TaxID=1908308 RepID=A0ABP9WT68_9GAMM